MEGNVLSQAAMNEIAQLNQNKSGLEQNAKDLYAKLGMEYFDLKAENPEEELAGTIEELKTLTGQMKKIDIRIKFLNGIVVCSECDTENSVNVSFCVNCGAKLPHKLVQNDANHCPNCGNQIAPGQRFCGSCGSQVPEMPVDETVEQTETAGEPSEFDLTFTEMPAAPIDEFVADVEVDTEVVAQEMNATDAPVFQGVVEGATSAPAAAFCANCGAKIIEPDSVFCAECGARLN